MIIDCRNVTPGEPLNSWQALGLKAISKLQGSRDVVLAFDLTGSVDFNDEGRIRVKQIIKDSLKPGDRVYVVPFASDVNPLNPKENSFLNPIKFTGKEEDINRILDLFPRENSSLENTDIQRAEAFIHKSLAQQNQCRFSKNEKIKPQSIVWITDAPLLTEAGISSDVWVETPANSSFRNKESPESKDRQQWIESLPLSKNTQKIVTNNNKSYELSVVDISPTVQEFCTPAPGGQVICSVNAYLVNQLWLPILLLLFGGIGFAGLFLHWRSISRPWRLQINKGDEFGKETYTIKNGDCLNLGGEGQKCIELPGNSEQMGYLERKGNKLMLNVTKQGSLSYNGKMLGSTPVDTHKISTIKLCDRQDSPEQTLKLLIKVIKK